MIYTHVAAGLLGAALAATAAWQVQGWRYGGQIARIEAAQVQQAETAVREALAKTQVMQHKKDEALHEATKRAQRHAAAAAAARADADGLRDELATARDQLPGAACASVRQHAATVNQLFAQCAGVVEGLARQADGHAADALMFEQAWPTSR